MKTDPNPINITHHGAKTFVSGSCHLVQVQPQHGDGSINILVDCGIAQGHDPLVPFDQFPMPPADIEYLFLTHAHIDHFGWVPDLIDAGFSGKIICTHGTKALLTPMLRDAMAAIHHLSDYSTHADHKTLCDGVKSMPEPPCEIRLVHEEPEAQK